MRIVVNTQPLSGPQTGIARYVKSLYRRLSTWDGVSVASLQGPLVNSVMPSGRIAAAAVPGWARPYVRRVHRAWYDRQVAGRTRRLRGEIYHETTMLGPRRRLPIPVVVTVYDLSLHGWTQHHPADRVDHYGRLFRQRLGHVDHVVTLTETVRREFIDAFDWAPERVTAIPLAAESIFRPRGTQEVAAFAHERGLPARYVLHVGAREPRKNLPRLLEALATSRRDLHLICVGPDAWGADQFEQALGRFQLDKRVRVMSTCSDEQLALLYSGALALVYPSLYEGFGLPIIEAMACGCPVLCSNRGSLAEVAGDAAMLCDPEDISALGAALERLEDERLRDPLRRRGLERAAQFDWQLTAGQTHSLFAQLLA